ncbi:heme-degrading domain-containing protein [Planosporangium thailandense]|uniref:UPF0303 protein HC031_27415 n=1 Tax=Planosporangium thailandense TaxID=765197 RepID=A0ABX0Y4T8_9ACTN|nr:heme-degrading domain-containing protein [Planosporangium thailandense]NJC73424.1 heme-degrading domain-containing protein [Planosporangium thailandense]
MANAEELARQLAAEEDDVQFDSFDLDAAWALGTALVAAARERAHPLAIDIRLGAQQVFHAALPGSTADNDEWIERKARTVMRFNRSSYRVAVEAERDGYDFDEKFRLDRSEYVASGGSFPLRVRGAGLIGTVTVSGLPGPQDHAFLVESLRAFLAAPRPDGGRNR